MTDLVKRLRAPPLVERNEGIKIEAADEIERLTTQVTALRAILREMLKPIAPRDKDDIERFMREGAEIERRALAILGENEG